MTGQSATVPWVGRLSLAAVITFVISAGMYLCLFALMWVPVYAGFGGWMFMYPMFLLAWVPIEVGAVAALTLGVVSAVQTGPQSGRRSAWIATIGGAALTALSLPLLWFGSFPVPLLTGWS